MLDSALTEFEVNDKVLEIKLTFHDGNPAPVIYEIIPSSRGEEPDVEDPDIEDPDKPGDTTDPDEKPDPDKPGQDTPSDTDKPSGTKDPEGNADKAVQTGDSADMAGWLFAAMIAGAVLIMAAGKTRRSDF